MTERDPAPWRVAAGRATGSSHRRDGAGCQDAYLISGGEADGDFAKPLLLAVADGAGSAENSADGAAIVLRTLAEQIEARSDATMIDVVTAAREAVRLAARTAGKPVESYACTLVALLIHEDRAQVAQIGDGLVVLRGQSGQPWTVPVAPQCGTYANETFFLTDADALDRLNIAEIASVEEAVLLTDGLQDLCYERGSPYSPFFDSLIDTVASTHDDPVGLSQALVQWLTSPAVDDRTDDDRALILATRRSQ